MQALIDQLRNNLETAASKWQDRLPVNRVMTEWEVVFVLGALAHDAGITLVEGSDSYPDALLTLNSDPSHTIIRTELEYFATNFNHNPAGCDLVLCWVADVPAIGQIPVLGLRPWFPNTKTVGVTTIRHDNKPLELQQIFATIDNWIRSTGLQPFDMARNQAFTKSHRYHIPAIGRYVSLCTVEYMPERSAQYVEFRFQGKTIEEIGLWEQADLCWQRVNALALRVPSIVPKYTVGSREFKMRLYPQVLTDQTAIPEFLAIWDSLLRRATGAQ